MDVRFTVAPGQVALTRALLTEVDTELTRLISERLQVDPSVAWLEAGGYVKWAKGAIDLEPQIRREELFRVQNLPDIARLTER